MRSTVAPERERGKFRSLLRLPGTAAFTAAGAIARMPLQGAALAVTLAVVFQTGSYATAGLLVGVLTVARGISAPSLSRLVDRYGQFSVMSIVVIGQFVSFGLLTVGIALDWSLWALTGLAALTGLGSGAPHAYVRARWAQAVESRSQLDTAFAWESLVESLGVAVTPLILVALVDLVSPFAGLVFLTVVAVAGGLALYLQRSTEPPVVRTSSGGRVPIGPGSARLIAVYASYCFGAAFTLGGISIVAVEQGEASPIPGFAGLLLTSFASGTMLGAFLYGSMNWRHGPARRLRVIIPVFAATTLTMLFLEGSPLLLLGAFVIGIPFIALLTSTNRAVQEVAPKGRLTEMLAWLATAQGIGLALGSLLAGAAIDRSGYQTAALVFVLSGAIVLVALACETLFFRGSRRGAAL